jgi:hypothetical protein
MLTQHRTSQATSPEQSLESEAGQPVTCHCWSTPFCALQLLQITPWDKNCKCCYETPKETSSCLAFICTPSYTLYFSNTCYNPLQLRWVDGAGQTRTAVFTSADGSALMDDNRRTVSINPK